MFDNLGTALVQAFGFFVIFGFFVYQTLFADKSKGNTFKRKNYETKIESNQPSKKGIFNRKKEKVDKEDKEVKPLKKGLFGRNPDPIKDEIKPKRKKGWFK